jgi:hypothetical protein
MGQNSVIFMKHSSNIKEQANKAVLSMIQLNIFTIINSYLHMENEIINQKYPKVLNEIETLSSIIK